MLHVLLKTGSVLEPGEEGVRVSSGAPREVLTHGEVDGARHLVSQSTDRRDEIFDLFLRGPFPNGEKHEMIHHSTAPCSLSYATKSSKRPGTGFTMGPTYLPIAP